MKDSKYGFKVFLFCMIVFLLPSCAKFDLDLGSSGGGGPVVPPPPPPPIGFGLTTPSDNDRFFRGSSVNAEGVCDEAGGSVSITGTSIVGGAISGDCAADGTFSIPITIVSSGEGLDLNATQTDSDGAPQNDSAINLMVHCVQDALSELMTCPLTGSGNSTDPYMLSDIECLQEMRDGLRCYYALANDIDASATQTWNGGLGFEPVPLDALALKFEGFLDGRGHTISGLHIEQRNETGTGLFSKVFAGIDPTPRVHDLIISGATVEGYHKVGVVVGGMNNARIRNV